jgi:hypothetical protein
MNIPQHLERYQNKVCIPLRRSLNTNPPFIGDDNAHMEYLEGLHKYFHDLNDKELSYLATKHCQISLANFDRQFPSVDNLLGTHRAMRRSSFSSEAKVMKEENNKLLNKCKIDFKEWIVQFKSDEDKKKALMVGVYYHMINSGTVPNWVKVKESAMFGYAYCYWAQSIKHGWLERWKEKAESIVHGNKFDEFRDFVKEKYKDHHIRQEAIQLIITADKGYVTRSADSVTQEELSNMWERAENNVMRGLV